jgi:hypothetical protein
VPLFLGNAEASHKKFGKAEHRDMEAESNKKWLYEAGSVVGTLTSSVEDDNIVSLEAQSQCILCLQAN